MSAREDIDRYSKQAKTLDDELGRVSRTLEVKQHELDTKQTELRKLEAECSTLQEQVDKLTERRTAVQTELKAVTRGLKQAEKALEKEGTIRALEVDDLEERLLGVAQTFLGNLSLSALQGLDEALAPYKPAGDEDDLPWADAPAEQVAEQDDLPWADAPVVSSESVDAQISGNKFGPMKISLADFDAIGALFKVHHASLIANAFTVKVADRSIEFPAQSLVPVSVDGGGLPRLKVDCLRMLYTKVFLDYLKQSGADMSASSILKYLIGFYVDDRNGVLIPMASVQHGLTYYRLEDADGHIIQEVDCSGRPSSVYVLYQDEAGNRVLGGKTVCSYKDIAQRTFSCYLSEKNASRLSREGSQVDLPGLLKKSYLVVDSEVLR